MALFSDRMALYRERNVDGFRGLQRERKRFGVLYHGAGVAALDRTDDAVGMTAGADFDDYLPWGGMRRVQVSPSGDVLAYYDEPYIWPATDYEDDDSDKNVMVEIPKFYVKMSRSGTGDHRKLEISPYPYSDMRLHPAFYRAGQV